jgi:TFIIF-interacting CTD phosphatase-like protein
MQTVQLDDNLIDDLKKEFNTSDIVVAIQTMLQNHKNKREFEKDKKELNSTLNNVLNGTAKLYNEIDYKNKMEQFKANLCK